MKKQNKGFTLLEMLIVVAIIGVLVSILVPTFASELERAREAADAANIRSAISETYANYLTGEKTGLSQEIEIAQKEAGWQNGLTAIGGYEISKNAALQMKDLTKNVIVVSWGINGPTFTAKTVTKQ